MLSMRRNCCNRDAIPILGKGTRGRALTKRVVCADVSGECSTPDSRRSRSHTAFEERSACRERDAYTNIVWHRACRR